LNSNLKLIGAIKVMGAMRVREEISSLMTPTHTADEIPKKFESEYSSKLTTAADAVAQIPSTSTLAMGLSPGQPPALLSALATRGKAKEITGVKVYYSVSGRHLRNTILRFEQLRRFEPYCLFFGATERELATRARAEGRGKVVNFVPNFFYQLDRNIADLTDVETFVATVSPMDCEGNFSLGTNSDYSFLLSQKSKRIVVEVNSYMPRVAGPSQIHLSAVSAIVENHVPLEQFPTAPPKELDPAVARNVVELIPDGATLQMGIGSLPSVVCNFLSGHKDLGIHTELLTPAMTKLIQSGVVNNRRKNLDTGKAVFTFALGDNALYEYMNENPAIEGHPVSYVNDPRVIACQDNFHSINSTLEIDLTGQCNSEHLGGYQYSGAGGQVDFVRGAYASRGGKSMIVLHSTAADGAVSRIVPRLHGPVTTSRMDVQWVVTEHGSVNLKGKSETGRAQALISIAAPHFREQLLYEAKEARLI
jgi:itaconate CoA-transferase